MSLIVALASCGPSPAPSRPASPPERPLPIVQPTAPRRPLTLASGGSVALGELRLELVAIVTEEIAEAPGAPEAYPAGSGVTVTVALGGQRAALTRLSPGYTSESIAWLAGHRLELVSADHRGAQLLVDRVTERVTATRSLRVRVGDVVRLHDRVDFTFRGHGHKSVEPGMTSPLLVRVAFDGVDQQLALEPPRDVTFQWRDLRFRLGAYEYDDFMELVVEQLALEPVQP